MIVIRKTRGRPRKDGARHPSGQLVQKVEPNAKVVAIRRALAGEAGAAPLASAEDPMALALARGWITAEQHQAGQRYAALWRRAHPQRRRPVIEETSEPAARDPRRVGEMSDAEIAAAFEAALLSGGREAPSEASEAEARQRYNELSRGMTAGEQNEVFLCFCLVSWPQWLLQRCAGRFDTSWERKHRLLVGGLEALSGMLRPRRRVPGVP
jgi:hypothetical protein